MSYLREIDRWFIGEVLPHEAAYRARARRFCATAEDADDLVQEAYARLFALDAWRELANPRAYTLSIVQNLAVQRLRHAKVVDIRQVANLEVLEPLDEDPGVQRAVIARDQLRRLLQAVERLPAPCREAVVMRRFHELPPAEIARRLGLSLSTLEKRLARGLYLLTQALDGAGTRETRSRPDLRRKGKKAANGQDI